MDEGTATFLSGTSFFGGLTPEVKKTVLSMLKERRIGAGEVLFEEGDSGKSMYIVGKGAILVKRCCAHGRDARLWMMRPGDFFGVTTLIEMEPRPFSALAEVDSVLHELTNVDLYQLYKKDPKTYLLVLQNINRELCRKLRKAAQRIAALEDHLRELEPPLQQR